MKRLLWDIAHARSGDKGDVCNIGVIARAPDHYPLLVRELSAERVRAYFGDWCRGSVERFELPNLHALNFLLRGALDGGALRSLRLDRQGKTYGFALIGWKSRSDVPSGPSSEDPEIPPWILSAARALGLNPIQTRWRLLRLYRRWRAFRSELAPAERRFEHQICAECGAVQPRESRSCSSCGHALASSASRFMNSLGLSIPTFISVSSLLGLAMILIYFRMMMAYPGDGYMKWDVEPMVAHGGLWPPAWRAGQWWRVGTCNFVHLGILHIGFNLMGLTMVGPAIEEVFGRGRMVFFFILTGLVAMLASVLLMPLTPTAGASGALMGLIGAAAAWGHRRKTEQGRDVRNQMIKWGIYTMLFGLLVNGNHVAHAVGFLSGGALGLAFDPTRLEKTRGTLGATVMGTVGGLASAGFVLLCLVPPPSARAYAADLALLAKASRLGHDVAPQDHARLNAAGRAAFRNSTDASCKLFREGKIDEATEAFPYTKTDVSREVGLRNHCMFVDAVIAKCDRYRKEGLDPLLPPSVSQNAQARAEYADYYAMWCDSPP